MGVAGGNPMTVAKKKSRRRAAQRALVRARRPARLRPSLARHADGLRAGGLGRPAGDRHPQHLVGRPALPHALQEPRRRREARHPAGRRLPDGAAGAVAVGKLPEAHHHALPQSPGDGRRGAVARPSRRRRRADGRLRQDHAGPAAGRHQRGPAGDLPAGRADAARQLEGQGAGLGLRRLEILGRAPRRQDLRLRLGRCRGGHRAQLRHLHDHGHRRHHDGDGRDARHDAARRLVDPGGRRQPYPHGVGDRPAHRRHGVGGPDAEEDPDPRRVPERHHRGHGGGLLDQRHHPSDRAGAPRRPGYRPRRFRARQPQGAGDRQHPPERRQVPDGGFLLCRRPAGADGADPRPSASRCPDRHRQDAWARTSRAPRSTTTT